MRSRSGGSEISRAARPRSSAHAAAPTRDRAMGHSNAREAREAVAPASRLDRIGVDARKWRA
jgi:hypothetical protein